MASMAEPITATPSVPQPQKEQEQKQESVIPEPEIETTPTTATELPFNSDPEPVYAEETIELDDAVADQTRSQGIRGAFVALPETAAHPAPQTTNPDVPKPVREDKLIQPQQAPSKRPALEANTAPTATARSTGKAPASQNVVSKQSTAPVVAEKAETRRTAPAKQEIKPQLKPALSEPAIERPAKSSANSQSDYQWP